jgi:GT2 family glycosyltransferase
VSKISYIIPTRGGDTTLLWHLGELNKQTFNDFEVIVVFDEEHSKKDIDVSKYRYPLKIAFVGSHRGPASARNIGVEMSKSNIVMFVGHDCIPDRNLITHHYLSHKSSYPRIVQGYTPWHDAVKTSITDFIDTSGLQANWSALMNEDKKWYNEVSAGFFLTTNVSIDKVLFEFIGGFDERFSGAAWEDVELGYRLHLFGARSRVNPYAINYHHHRYDILSFLQRCFMEGEHRMTMCKMHPEMSWNLLEIDNIKQFKNIGKLEIINKALRARFVDDITSRYETYALLCKGMTSKGIQKNIESNGGVLNTLHYVNISTEAIQVTAAQNAIDSGHYSYATHCGEWMIADNQDKWYPYAFAGEVLFASGDNEMAERYFIKASSLSPDGDWVDKRIKELS